MLAQGGVILLLRRETHGWMTIIDRETRGRVRTYNTLNLLNGGTILRVEMSREGTSERGLILFSVHHTFDGWGGIKKLLQILRT